MSLRNDDQTPALSQSAREQLVRDVVAAQASTTEPEWIEWKGPISSVRNWAPAIAKIIFGMANRTVPRAERYMAGWGYIVLGAEPGAVHGIARDDTADLSKWIGKYIGPRGPQWDPFYIDVDGKDVLMVAVAPPKPGDPTFRFRKGFQAKIDGKDVVLRDGDVFVRRLGETRMATAEEQEELDQRVAGRSRQLRVSVINRSAVMRTITTTDAPMKAWIAREQTRLLTPLNESTRAKAYALDSATLVMSGLGSERRSVKRFREQVDAYEAKVRKTWWKRVLMLATEHRIAELDLDVRNETDHNFNAVKLEITVPGSVTAHDESYWVNLPSAPIPWGQDTMLTSLAISTPMPYLAGLDHLNTRSAAPRAKITHARSATIEFPEFHLWPDTTEEMDQIFLVFPAERAAEEVEVAWQLRSRDISGVQRDSFTLRLDPEPIDPLTLVGKKAPNDEDEEE